MLSHWFKQGKSNTGLPQSRVAPPHQILLVKFLRFQMGRERIGSSFFLQRGSSSRTPIPGYYKNVIFITISQSPDLKVILETMWVKILKRNKVKFQNIEDGHMQLQQQLLMQSEPTLIILDDVWSKEDLDKLLFEGTRYKTLITSRDSSIIPKTFSTEVYQLPLLDEQDALSLLCFWAFGQTSIPSTIDANLVKEVQEECGGLPLALKVIGSSLKGKTHVAWERAKNVGKKMSLKNAMGKIVKITNAVMRKMVVGEVIVGPKIEKRDKRREKKDRWTAQREDKVTTTATRWESQPPINLLLPPLPLSLQITPYTSHIAGLHNHSNIASLRTARSPFLILHCPVGLHYSINTESDVACIRVASAMSPILSVVSGAGRGNNRRRVRSSSNLRTPIPEARSFAADERFTPFMLVILMKSFIPLVALED
ncbi:hypothetical protein SUGI_0696100 [Cryptomeria japonica]|nr:hypothetical protein SUGI_0696100 [Cryptomeria japonica]